MGEPVTPTQYWERRTRAIRAIAWSLVRKHPRIGVWEAMRRAAHLVHERDLTRQIDLS